MEESKTKAVLRAAAARTYMCHLKDAPKKKAKNSFHIRVPLGVC